MAEVTIIRGEAPDDIDPPDNPDATPEDATEEAPYGYKADGTPRKRPGRKPGSTSSGGTSKSLQGLREPLIQRLVEYFGGPLVFVSPIAAAVWEERAEKTADAILVLAARSNRWRKWVERLIAGSASGDLGITLVGVGAGILVDSGKLEPQGKIQSYFHIDQIYVELYGRYQEATTNGTVEERGLFAEV